ncbi:MAG: glycoside hydrolase family 3 C-terminal domain-containing protein [Proteobacteria bacterium]|nr:glycoside hydrolase family 3 C-terminal domain-containing protein [Pseudomonadota bacterium]
MKRQELLEKLTLDEKALLTAGSGMWSIPGVERLGLPAIHLTDGPSGARGSSLLGVGRAKAVCIPCGSALGASWNPALIERVGAMLGQEARTKDCRVLLAPTVNLHRSPLGGRNFECYSEDPLLSGKIAAGFVRGVQSQGVATTVKHFAANDAEFERTTIDSVVDERTLRELTLLPFEIAVKEGRALGIMTAYNRLNGVYCAEDRELLQGILRDQWGFDGFVVTDWFAVGSSERSPVAGLDLQMPGPGRFYGEALAEAARDGRVDEELVDAQVSRMLGVWERIGALDDSGEREERNVDLPEHRALARETAAEGMVLLANDGLLPLAADGLRRVAVIGPNADRCQIGGGGSAALRPHYRVTPLEALREKLGPDVEIVFERGAWTDKNTAALPKSALRTAGGDPGLDVAFFAGLDWEGDPVVHEIAEDGQLIYAGSPTPGVPKSFSLRATGTFQAVESGRHTFTLMQIGRARLWIDGEIVLDGIENPPPRGTEFFRVASRELEAQVELRAGQSVELRIEFTAADAAFVAGVRIGHRPPTDVDFLARAEAAARDADAVVLLLGTNADWESEGHDRDSMDLPGDQDELVRRVCAANPRTVACINAGSPVTLPWAGEPGALLQIWFGGQEMAGALADVLLGDAEPAGRLPTTFPERLEHNPSYGNFPGENSELRYGEGLLVGYRWYQSRHLPVRFPFGHGLSYTTFEWESPVLSADTLPDGAVQVDVTVRNTGTRRGADVVQCYVAPEASRCFRPQSELKAFQKVWLDPGESATVTLALDVRSFAYWDPADPGFEALRARLGPAASLVPSGKGKRRTEAGWYADAGRYALRIGRSSRDVVHTCEVTLPETLGPLAP